MLGSGYPLGPVENSIQENHMAIFLNGSELEAWSVQYIILLKCATANNSGFFPHGLDLEKDQSLRRRGTNQS